MCPQLTSARHLLRTRLSRTLINRRQFLRRTSKLPQHNPRPELKTLPDAKVAGDINDTGATCTAAGKAPFNPGLVLNQMPLACRYLCCDDIILSDVVKIMEESMQTPIGKGLFLKMNSEGNMQLLLLPLPCVAFQHHTKYLPKCYFVQEQTEVE